MNIIKTGLDVFSPFLSPLNASLSSSNPTLNSLPFMVRKSPSLDLCTLQYIITHVFFPLQLPEGDDHTTRNSCLLAGAIASVLRLYNDHVDQAKLAQWHSISRMLDNLRAVVEFESLDRSQTISQLGSMNVGGRLPSLHSILEPHNA